MTFSRTLVLAAVLASASLPAFAQAVIGEMYASDASVHGSILFAAGGTKIQSGSSVTAGDAAAALKLTRGGEVRICPETTVSVTSSKNGRNLMFAMNTGSIEAHYSLGSTADTVMTPDFRILLAGPGIFHFAISADSQGNACVRALPHNTASLIVNEMNGDGTYQVKPNEQLEFEHGSVANPSALVRPDCGCPASVPQVQVAAATPPEPEPVHNQEEALPDGKHIQMDAPLVYKPGSPDEEMASTVARLRVTEGSIFPNPVVIPPPTVQPEVQAKPHKSQQNKGFFGKIGSFFAKMFK